MARYDTESFDIVNDVCSKWMSDERISKYFEKPTLAFMFVFFSECREGKQFRSNQIEKHAKNTDKPKNYGKIIEARVASFA